MKEIPIWQVHRGYWRGGLRENTMQAFYAAKRLGARMVELDVHLSLDGVPVVFHDYTLERIFHIKKSVSWMKWKDLSSLNITSLEDVLKSENVPDYINVELKSKNPLPIRLVRKVGRILKNSRRKKFMISSFNPMCLLWAKRLLPKIPRALVVGDEKVALGWRLKSYAKIASPDYLNVEQNLLLDEETRNAIIALKLPICVWTVNDEAQAKFFIDRGAVSIISDDPPPPSMR